MFTHPIRSHLFNEFLLFFVLFSLMESSRCNTDDALYVCTVLMVVTSYDSVGRLVGGRAGVSAG